MVDIPYFDNRNQMYVTGAIILALVIGIGYTSGSLSSLGELTQGDAECGRNVLTLDGGQPYTSYQQLGDDLPEEMELAEAKNQWNLQMNDEGQITYEIECSSQVD